MMNKHLKKIYNGIAENFKPTCINELIICESFPSSGHYFYIPKKKCKWLSGTIFLRHFGRLPHSVQEYYDFLIKLQSNGVFMVDIYENPLDVKENKDLVKNEIPKLPNRITKLNPKR